MSMSNRTILVIDDEIEQRILIRNILHLDAYRVLEAADYDVALAVQREHLGEIDLLLIDLLLPGLDGFQVIEQVRSDPQWRRIPIVVLNDFQVDTLTTLHYRNEVNAVLNRGAFHRDELLRRIHELVAQFTKVQPVGAGGASDE